MNTKQCCPICGTPYGKRKRCYRCTGTKPQRIERVCVTCGKHFFVQRHVLMLGKGNYCSMSCASKSRTGTRSGVWKGGRTISGYVYITIPGVGTFAEHRYVMSQHLGRPLKRNEQVHHINKDKTDNRLENLVLVTPKEHAQYHLVRSPWLKGKWSSAHDRCANCGRTDRKHAGRGLCNVCYTTMRRRNHALSLTSKENT